METIHFPDDARPAWLVHPVLALGNFDGLHRGHQKIIDRVKRGAAEHGGTPMAMTFDPHPPRVVRPDKAPPLLMTKTQRLEALHDAGIRCVAVVRFTHELSQWDPETFVRVVLAEWLRVSEVWVGANFLFGHGRTGNFSLLRMLGQRYGFRADKIDRVRYKDFVVSSTRIRRLVGEGRVDEAGALLGHGYYVDGTVVEGRGSMDESYLTGEPYVISKVPGSNVLSGAINAEAALTIRADQRAVDSRYAKIMRVMRESEQRRPKLRRLGDQLGAVYTPIAVGIAIAAWVAGVVREQVGDYAAAFVAAGWIAIIAGLAALAIRRPTALDAPAVAAAA